MTAHAGHTFLADQVVRRFGIASASALATLKAHKHDEPAQVLEAVRKKQQESALLRVAFVGQYSAGKSTIIAALTGNRSIRIGADITTDATTDYEWDGIRLTDTPGLWTERKDHDEASYRAIEEADLLVFVMTSDLFNRLTLANFKDLAYTRCYRHKIMLVVNKMSMEDAPYDELRANYTASLEAALRPHSTADFPVVFIDAAEYREADGDPQLVEASHFGELVESLNRFVRERGMLGRLDQPIRQALSIVEHALVMDGSNDRLKHYFMLLDRLEYRVHGSMEHSRALAVSLAEQLRSDIVGIGTRLARRIGDKNLDFERELASARVECESVGVQTVERLRAALDVEEAGLDGELSSVMRSELAIRFLAEAVGSSQTRLIGVVANEDATLDVGSVGTLYSILSGLSGGWMALIGGTSSTALMASNVAGTAGHQIVLNVGHFFGVKFAPWGAVHAAQALGGVAMVVGPVTALISAGVSVYNMVNEERQAQELRTARDKCRSGFVALGQELQNQVLHEFDHYRQAFFVRALEEISAQRQASLAQQSRLSSFQQELAQVSDELKSLIRLIADEPHSDSRRQ